MRKTFRSSLPSVSGYSGGGRTMIEAYEKHEAPLFETYALGLASTSTSLRSCVTRV